MTGSDRAPGDGTVTGSDTTPEDRTVTGSDTTPEDGTSGGEAPPTEGTDAPTDEARPGACVADPAGGVSGSGSDRSRGLGSGRDDGVPDFVASRDHVRESLVRFARSLRRAGATVPANAATDAARALVRTGFEEEGARAGLRATLVTRKEDIAVFDRQFPEFWRRLTAGLDPGGPAEGRDDQPDGGLAPLGGSPLPDAGPDPDGDGADTGDEPGDRSTTRTAHVGGESDPDPGAEDTESVTASVYSKTGAPVPVSVPPAQLRVDDDLAEPMRRLTRAIAGLRGRRWERDGRNRPDARRALRESFSTGGTVAAVPRRDRKRTAVRATLLVDVSQSVLDTVDRGFLLAVVHRAVAVWRDVRVFFFDEGLREVTGEFDRPTTREAVAALDRAETEWGGGTRIGAAFGRVRREFPDAVDRDTVAFVVSDGLETGDVADLERNAAWLSRRARGVVWCNPLAASPEYEPATRGMQAVLPSVDGVFAFAGPADVAEMARQIGTHGLGGSIGYEHDSRRRTGGVGDTTNNGDRQ